MPLLSNSNSDLRRDGIYTWSIPAHVVRLQDGRVANTCPSAGACAQVCYAKNGSYEYNNVKQKHWDNLQMLLDDMDVWEQRMIAELRAPKFRGKFVRIHDGGDFFSPEYLDAWLRIVRATPETTFYCYTKEVRVFREKVQGQEPENFKWLFSLGGRQDHLIDRDKERHAEVFPDKESLEAAGYLDQGESDLLAITLPGTKIGIVANNIKHFLKRQGASTLGDIQRDRHSPEHKPFFRTIKVREAPRPTHKIEREDDSTLPLKGMPNLDSADQPTSQITEPLTFPTVDQIDGWPPSGRRHRGVSDGQFLAF